MEAAPDLIAILNRNAGFGPGELNNALNSSVVSILITDNSMPDHPIVYCNKAFEEITGYTSEEVIGLNCRFLQGKNPDAEKATRIRSALLAGMEITIELINFKKDGTPFRNELHISPVKDASGYITHFISIQLDVTGGASPETNTAGDPHPPKKSISFIRMLGFLLPGFD